MTNWPFTEPGHWTGKTWRWASAEGITIEEAALLTSLTDWAWNVSERATGGFTFTLTKLPRKGARRNAMLRRHKGRG